MLEPSSALSIGDGYVMHYTLSWLSYCIIGISWRSLQNKTDYTEHGSFFSNLLLLHSSNIIYNMLIFMISLTPIITKIGLWSSGYLVWLWLEDKMIWLSRSWPSLYNIYAYFHIGNNLALSSTMGIFEYYILHRCHQIYYMPNDCRSHYISRETTKYFFLIY